MNTQDKKRVEDIRSRFLNFWPRQDEKFQEVAFLFEVIDRQEEEIARVQREAITSFLSTKPKN